MSYFNCRQGDRCEDCNGYVGPLDTYACLCRCHEYYAHDCEHTSLQHGADGCNAPGCRCAYMSWDES